ncbi:uncharacterized protein LOC117113364 isoform X2 [Anneissia japonica]|uniref:uncharacterized protein LOC117113364 isoform X2 n=1 Tax=Anneissia japonica TaxID=1529436 RepID=UPI001425BA85|nr:uncharacterized protein LOC117113364 isoform X2 [Anneissia japonica]
MEETGLSKRDFSQLLVDFSSWYDGLEYINMLKVLYNNRKHVPIYSDLNEATDVMSLLSILICSGNLSQTNLTILYDTIKVTGHLGFKSSIVLPTLQRIEEHEVSKLSWYRQFLLKLGMALTKADIVALDVRYNIPLLKKYKDSWHLILDLEQRNELWEEKMDDFIEGLPSYTAVKALLEVNRRAVSKQEHETYTSYYNRLKDNIRQSNMHIRKDVSGDGNCFLYCIQDQFERLGLPNRSAAQLRADLVDYLRHLDRKDPLIALTDDKYLDELSKDGTFVDETAIRGMSRILNHNFQIVTSQRKSTEQGYLVTTIQESSNPDGVMLFGQIGELHYISLGNGEASTSKKPKFYKGKSGKSKRPRKRRICDEGKSGRSELPKKLTLDEDLIIKEFLTKKLKQLYQDVNQMTPAIWHRHHRVDIAEVFTQLILLESNRKDKEESDEFKSTCIRKEGRPTSLTEVLGIIKSKDSCKLLITGGGGMGKTTLLKYITYKWATDELHAFAGKLLFLINIGDIKTSADMLELILKNIATNELILQHNLSTNSVERFLINNADDIVILLDGYDELHRDAKDPIYLFKGRELEKSTVVITSRPDYTIDLIKCCTVHIEVKGFSRRNIKKYIHDHFHSINKCELGELLMKEFNLVSEDECDWGGDHKEAFELCSSPLLLLMICTIWEQKKHLPKDLSVLFIELICCILSQYKCKRDDNIAISQINSVPEQYRLAILLLGECMYEGLKENKLSIDKHVLSNMTKNIDSVDLALKIGFVYEDSPFNPGDVREMYTPPHKLISEALAGFYLSNQIEEEHLKSDEYEVIRSNKYLKMTRVFTIGFLGAKAGGLLKHWLVIRASHFYSIAQCFTHIKEANEEAVLQELDKNMSTEMKSYCKQMCETYRSVLQDDKSVVSEHLYKLMNICCTIYEGNLVEKFISLLDASSEETFRSSCRSLVHILVIVEGLKLGNSWFALSKNPLFKYISNWKSENLNFLSAEMKYLKLNYGHTSVSLNHVFNSSFLIHLLTHSNNLFKLHITSGKLTESVLSVVIIELHKSNVKLKLTELDIMGNDLHNIDGTLLGKLFKISPDLNVLNLSSCSLSGDIVRAMITECQYSGVSLGGCNLIINNNNIDDALLGNLLKVSPNISGLYIASCGLSKASFNKMINGFHEIELCELDFSQNYLGNLDGKTFGTLLKMLPKLRYFNMSHCSLSGSIVNEMMEECGRMNVVLKDNLLQLKGNDLSDIDGKSLAELIKAFFLDHEGIFNWLNHSLTADNLQNLIESVSVVNKTFTWHWIDLSNINLSSISGKTLACLIKISPDLIHIDMSHCSLSGSIVNEMMEECGRMNVVLKDNLLQLKGNDLSDIDGKSLAELTRAYIRPLFLDFVGPFRWRNYSLTADNLQNLIESVSVVNKTLIWHWIDLININLSSISGKTLACLIKISPDLIRIDMRHCSLSGSIVNEMMEECDRMNVVLKDKSLQLEGNDLSDIDGKSLAELIRAYSVPFHLDPEGNFNWRNHSLTADNLQNLIESVSVVNKTFTWHWIDLSNVNLSSISGKTLACLIKISPDLIRIDMRHCSLSGSIVNEMMEECDRMNVVLKDKSLQLEGNDLSDIDGKSLAELIRAYAVPFHLDSEGNFNWRNHSLTADNLQNLIESVSVVNKTLTWDWIDLSNINLSSISGKTLACLIKISPDLISIDMRHCSLSGSIVNEMMEECDRMNVVLKDNSLQLEGNDLSDIDGKSLAELIRAYAVPFHLDPEGNFNWRNHSLTADNLQNLIESVSVVNKTLTWHWINLCNNNLSSISGKTLACLIKISPDLIRIDMRHCSLSGSIVNEMMEECDRMNVVLKDKSLQLKGNDLSDIDGKSLAELIRAYAAVHTRFSFPDGKSTIKWSDLSLTADNLQNLIESVSVVNKKLTWHSIDLSNINLSSISGKTLACLIKISPDLIRIYMRHCNLSGSIVNEMMEECDRMNVVLKDNSLQLEGNDLSDIDGKSLAEFIRAYAVHFFFCHKGAFQWRDYSLTADNLQNLIESVNVVNKKLTWHSIDLSNINLSSISGKTLACLIKISPDLIRIDMRHCSLSGSIVNEMMEECDRMNVVLKDNSLQLEGNDLSDIDGKSLAEFIRAYAVHFFLGQKGTFHWRDYSLTADNLQNLIESVSVVNKTLTWHLIDLSNINLSSISGKTLACLIKISPDLIRIDMSYSGLSGSIVKEMMEECGRMNVVLKDYLLQLEGNDLSDIDGKSLVGVLSL